MIANPDLFLPASGWAEQIKFYILAGNAIFMMIKCGETEWINRISGRTRMLS
ncbi:protein of unknown function [Ruminococcaceae bacterium BL-6]|nr:protein of unknown function [Ruminococcaceae bacterium BL-6]